MPLVAMSESESEVLPWSTWARMQMLRTFCAFDWSETRREGGIAGILLVLKRQKSGELASVIQVTPYLRLGPAQHTCSAVKGRAVDFGILEKTGVQ